jgi:hypothetical protein
VFSICRFHVFGVLRPSRQGLLWRVLQRRRRMLLDDGQRSLLLLGRRRFDVPEDRGQYVQAKVTIAAARTAGVAASRTPVPHWRQRLAVVLLVCAAALSPHAATSQDGATRTLTILAARCPAGYTGDASADECDDSPMPDVTFRVGRPYTDFVITARTANAGVVVFDIADLPLRGSIRVIEELPLGTARVVPYCVDDAGVPVPISDEPFPDNDPPIAAALVTVGEAGGIRCDWYNVPGSDEGATPASEASPTSVSTT